MRGRLSGGGGVDNDGGLLLEVVMDDDDDDDEDVAISINHFIQFFPPQAQNDGATVFKFFELEPLFTHPVIPLVVVVVVMVEKLSTQGACGGGLE